VILLAAAAPGLADTGLAWADPGGTEYFHADAGWLYNSNDQLTVLPGGQVASISSDDGSVDLYRCPHGGCAAGGYRWSDQPALFGSSVAAGPHGDIVVAGWTLNTHYRGVGALRLVSCPASGCRAGAASRGAILHRAVVDPESNTTALESDVRSSVARDGRGYVVASIGDDQLRTVLRVFRCADARCAHPVRLMAMALPHILTPDLGVSMDVAGGHLAVAVQDDESTRLDVVTCAVAACTPRVVHPVPARSTPQAYRFQSNWHVARVLARHGRGPLIVDDFRRGGTTLIDCSDTAYRHRHLRHLAYRGAGDPASSVALDHAGRPALAVRDAHTGDLTLVSCLDIGCRHTSTARLAAWGATTAPST
jgi:hypothetical protein